MAQDAPTSQSSARCSTSTPGAAVIDGRKPSAVAAYAITHSQTYATQPVRSYPGRLIGVLVLRHQRQRRLEKNVEVEQHRPVLDVVEIELAAPAVDLGPAGDARLDAVAREIAVHRFVEQPALQFALHSVRRRADQREIAFEHD